MTTLEDLYFGNINPNERKTKRGSQIDRLVMEFAPDKTKKNITDRNIFFTVCDDTDDTVFAEGCCGFADFVLY